MRATRRRATFQLRLVIVRTSTARVPECSHACCAPPFNISGAVLTQVRSSSQCCIVLLSLVPRTSTSPRLLWDSHLIPIYALMRPRAAIALPPSSHRTLHGASESTSCNAHQGISLFAGVLRGRSWARRPFHALSIAHEERARSVVGTHIPSPAARWR